MKYFFEYFKYLLIYYFVSGMMIVWRFRGNEENEMDLKKLDTEQQNPDSMSIDTMETSDILSTINAEDRKIADIVSGCISTITKLVDEISERMHKGGRLIYIGAGTSGRLGVLDASECPPTYGVSDKLVIGLIAGGYEALLKAKEGAEDDEFLAQEDLKNIGLQELDTVIGLAASGRTPYVLGGLDYANRVHACTGAISCVHDAKISQHATYAIEAVTGAEVITGSTRMKAGTAQKMILNMISTAVMIRYGKVYQNLMVDVQPTNEKLVERAQRIIMSATDCSYEEASSLLKKSGNNVKIAICMALSEADKESCEIMLNQQQGNVSQTIRKLIK